MIVTTGRIVMMRSIGYISKIKKKKMLVDETSGGMWFIKTSYFSTNITKQIKVHGDNNQTLG